MFNDDGVVKKENVIEAFAVLVDREYTIILGKRPDWNSATLIKLEQSAKMLAKVKLGNTTLFDFLKMISFDGDDQATLMEVVRTFENCSRADGLGDSDNMRCFRQLRGGALSTARKSIP